VTLSPCMACGAPIDGTRCTDCSTEQRKSYTFKPKATSTERGYDTAWRNLSERARRMQPFCTDCGREDRLTADHSPEAWRRHEAGLPIRLKDIEVVCIECNIDREPVGFQPTLERGRQLLLVLDDQQSHGHVLASSCPTHDGRSNGQMLPPCS